MCTGFRQIRTPYNLVQASLARHWKMKKLEPYACIRNIPRVHDLEPSSLKGWYTTP